MEELQYPIGRFQYKGVYAESQRKELIQEITLTPERLKEAIKGLTKDQIDTPYRPGGWTVRQVVHHVADSHINCYVRFKWTLTEETPNIKAYDEKKWAELYDSLNTPLEVSLSILENIHKRWVLLLESFSPNDFTKAYNHPENGLTTLDRAIGLYAWHGNHHIAHITSLRKRMGWS